MGARVSRTGEFDNRTVLIAGAGCNAGALLGRFYAGAGARVVLIDNDEPAMLNIARRQPSRIDTLRLDLRRPALCRRLGEIWDNEPLHVLVHLQLLVRTSQQGAALASVEALTLALAPALAGRGRVLAVFAAPRTRDAAGRAEAGAAARAMRAALEHLPRALQDRLGGQGITVNALRLPAEDDAGPARGADVIRAAVFLTRPGGARVGGAVLPLLPRAD